MAQPSRPKPDNPFYTIGEACAYLGISRMTLLEAEERQLIQPIRTPGGHRRYTREDLACYLTGQSGDKSAGGLVALPGGGLVALDRMMSVESWLRQIVLLLQVEMAGLFVLAESGHRLTLVGSFGIPRWLLSQPILIGLDGVSGQGLAMPGPVVFDMAQSELPLAEIRGGQGICAPLIAAGQKLGTVQVFASQRRQFFPSEINILATFGAYLAELLVYKQLATAASKVPGEPITKS